MFIEWLPTSNSPSQIYHPKFNILTEDTVVLDMIVQKYFKDLFLDDVVCENYSPGSSE